MENKITGLPYNMEDMDNIRNNGAIVNMNDLHFPNIENDMLVKVSFIFLRNTDYPVTYDFSKCSFELKSEYLLTYLTDSIEYKIDDLIQTWLAILCCSVGILLEDTGILTIDELQRFVKDNLDLIGQLLHLIISMPVYIISRFKYEDCSIDISDIPVNDSKLFNDNINYLLLHPAVNILLQTDTTFEPENYIQYFTDTNDKLFSALQGHPYMALLIGMVEKTPEEWKDFFNAYNSIFTK